MPEHDSIAYYRIAVINAFNKLHAILQEFSAQIYADQNLLCWAMDLENILAETYTDHRMLLVDTILQLAYLPAQLPKASLLVPGVVAASPATLAYIPMVNAAKDEFKAAMLQLKTVKIKLTDTVLMEEFSTILQQQIVLRHNNQRHALAAQTLQKIGLARLNLKQCYRHIPCLTHAPTKISWTWANTRAITKITVQQAITKLEQKTRNPSVLMQIQKAASLAHAEQLAIVQNLAPHLRANILFAADNTNARTRQMIKASLPIFYPVTALRSLPMLKLPKAKLVTGERLQRNDLKLDLVPFLPAIRVHRYL